MYKIWRENCQELLSNHIFGVGSFFKPHPVDLVDTVTDSQICDVYIQLAQNVFFATLKSSPKCGCLRALHGGFRLGPGGTGPPNLAQVPPSFLIGFIVISLSRCCLPNDEGPGLQIFFLEPPLVRCVLCCNL